MRKLFYVTIIISLFFFTGCNNDVNTDSTIENKKSQTENSINHATDSHQENKKADHQDQLDDSQSSESSHTHNGDSQSHTNDHSHQGDSEIHEDTHADGESQSH